MDLELLKVVILAVFQGVTEFLPISSSGHLVLLQNSMGMAEENLLLTVVLHGGTLISIVAFYWRDLLDLLKPGKRRVIFLVAVGTLPLVVIGLVVKDMVEAHFASPALAGLGLLGTAGLLLLLYRNDKDGIGFDQMSWRTALAVGLVQTVAILPGVSRSGSTIAMATRMGIEQEHAARFSFFLGIPAIGGAVVLTAKDIVTGEQTLTAVSPLALVVGLVVSFAVGYVSLCLLIRILRKGKLAWFGYYCLGLGILVIVHSFI